MNNFSNCASPTMHQDLFSPTARIVINSIFAILSIIGILNNFLTLTVIYRENALRRPYNIILMNLFIADMMSGFAVQPFIWVDPTKSNSKGTIANVICAISVGIVFFIICMTVNSMSLSALTILRYLSIVRNYHGILITSNKHAKVYCVFTWVVGVLIMLLSATSLKYDNKELMCYREWPKWINGAVFSVLTTVLSLVIPALLMIFCYTALLARIWKQSKITNLTNSVTQRAKKGVAILLGLLILSFFVCWSPLFFVWFLGRTFNYFSKGREGEYSRQRWLRITMLFIVLNSVVDPLIYAYSSSDYRKGLIKLFHLMRNRLLRMTQPNRVDTTTQVE